MLNNITLKEYATRAVYYQLSICIDGKLILVVGKPIEWKLYVEQTDHVLLNDATFTGKLQASVCGEHYATFQFGNAELTLWDSLDNLHPQVQQKYAWILKEVSKMNGPEECMPDEDGNVDTEEPGEDSGDADLVQGDLGAGHDDGAIDYGGP